MNNLISALKILDLSADGILGFLGEIIGAVATIIAVISTIKYEKKKEVRERVVLNKPWITTDYELISDNAQLSQLRNKVLYVYKFGSGFCSSSIIPMKLENKKYEFNSTECVIYYTFLNSGGNTATNLNIEINGKKILQPFCLPLGKEQKWVIILPKINDENESKYTISFNYGDIVSGTQYEQHEVLTIKKYFDGLTLSQDEKELLTSPNAKEKKNKWRK